MDYDPSQPKHTPIIISIVLTIVFVLLMTIALIYFLKGHLNHKKQKMNLFSEMDLIYPN